MQPQNIQQNFEKIIGRRINNGKTEYKIQLKNSSESTFVWENITNLGNYTYEINEYESKNPPQKRGRRKKIAIQSKIPLDSNQESNGKPSIDNIHKLYKNRINLSNSSNLSLIEEEEHDDNEIESSYSDDVDDLLKERELSFKVNKIIGIYKSKNFFRLIVEKKYKNGKKSKGYLDYQDFDKVSLKQNVDFIHSTLSC